MGALFPAAGWMVLYCLKVYEPERILFLLYEMSLWTLVFGGILQVFGQQNFWIVGGIFGSLFMIEKRLKHHKRQNRCMRDVVLRFHGRECKIRGFADTGNQLIDPITKKPVSVVTQEVWDKLLDQTDHGMYRLIPYKSVGMPHGLMAAIQIDSLIIIEGTSKKTYEKPMIALTKQPFAGLFSYSILLHSDYC